MISSPPHNIIMTSLLEVSPSIPLVYTTLPYYESFCILSATAAASAVDFGTVGMYKIEGVSDGSTCIDFDLDQ